MEVRKITEGQEEEFYGLVDLSRREVVEMLAAVANDDFFVGRNPGIIYTNALGVGIAIPLLKMGFNVDGLLIVGVLVLPHKVLIFARHTARSTTMGETAIESLCEGIGSVNSRAIKKQRIEFGGHTAKEFPQQCRFSNAFVKRFVGFFCKRNPVRIHSLYDVYYVATG